MKRRHFLEKAALSSASFFIVPRHVIGGNGYTAPSDKLNIACIGVGGKGEIDVREVSSQNIFALCDVDKERAAKTFNAYPQARKYEDYREMLEENMDEIDAVTISTPDHGHFVQAMAAIGMGKHVYLQKPLTRTVKEVRELTEAARKQKVATQMGNQNHDQEGPRVLLELIRDGAIGEIERVHVWTNRPVWPQGIEKRPSEKQKVPAHLNWDLWLHPAPARPYHTAYVPFNWRGWWDFGTGALGDMGCHLIDFPYWALKLDYPESVQASSTKVFEETAPLGSMVHYFFPARYKMPPVHLTWYDGGMLPPQPKGLTSYQISDHHSGMIFEGREGTIVYKYVVDSPTLIVGGKEVNYPKPPQLVERSPGHYNEWIEACKGGNPASANFEYSGPLTEVVMLGNVAIRSGREMLQFDPVNLKIPNKPDAEKYL